MWSGVVGQACSRCWNSWRSAAWFTDPFIYRRLQNLTTCAAAENKCYQPFTTLAEKNWALIVVKKHISEGIFLEKVWRLLGMSGEACWPITFLVERLGAGVMHIECDMFTSPQEDAVDAGWNDAHKLNYSSIKPNWWNKSGPHDNYSTVINLSQKCGFI